MLQNNSLADICDSLLQNNSVLPFVTSCCRITQCCHLCLFAAEQLSAAIYDSLLQNNSVLQFVTLCCRITQCYHLCLFAAEQLGAAICASLLQTQCCHLCLLAAEQLSAAGPWRHSQFLYGMISMTLQFIRWDWRVSVWNDLDDPAFDYMGLASFNCKLMISHSLNLLPLSVLNNFLFFFLPWVGCGVFGFSDFCFHSLPALHSPQKIILKIYFRALLIICCLHKFFLYYTYIRLIMDFKKFQYKICYRPNMWSQ